MDLMVGSVDASRLRRDLLRYYRGLPNQRSPLLRNKIYTVETANEQELLVIARQENLEIRPYIR